MSRQGRLQAYLALEDAAACLEEDDWLRERILRLLESVWCCLSPAERETLDRDPTTEVKR